MSEVKRNIFFVVFLYVLFSAFSFEAALLGKQLCVGQIYLWWQFILLLLLFV